jgi:hypothetical protein
VVEDRMNQVRNITFAADEALIVAAREQAAAEGSSLNEQFKLWLAQYAARRRAARAMEVVQRLSERIDFGAERLTRERRNERR